MSCILDGGMVSDLCYTPRSVILWMIWTGFAPNLLSLIWSISSIDVVLSHSVFSFLKLSICLLIRYVFCSVMTIVVLKTVEFRLHSAGQSLRRPSKMTRTHMLKLEKKAATPAKKGIVDLSLAWQPTKSRRTETSNLQVC